MPSKDDLPATSDPENLPNRRDSLKLIGGIVALATGLGVPLRALGKDTAMMTLKCHRAAEEGGQLIGSADLPASVAEYLASPAGARMQIKMHHQLVGELGSMKIPEQVVIKLQRAQSRKQ